MSKPKKTRKTVYIYDDLLAGMKEIISSSPIEITETSVINAMIRKGLNAHRKEREK